jgi:dTMP kinase
MKGVFITFEGCDGSGKTTQISLLERYLRDEGCNVLVTREPGGDPVAENVRSVLLASESRVSPRTELLLFLAARAQVVDFVIRPALERGDIVLCDRFADSTVTYQGYAREQDLDWVRRLNAYATNGLTPDKTLLLDIDPSEGLSRQTDRNRMEAETLVFHQRVREGYLAEARLFPERFHVIDASENVRLVHQAVLEALKDILEVRKRKTGMSAMHP